MDGLGDKEEETPKEKKKNLFWHNCCLCVLVQNLHFILPSYFFEKLINSNKLKMQESMLRTNNH